MNAVHRKHVFSDKSIPHYCEAPEVANFRYQGGSYTGPGHIDGWSYMIAPSVDSMLTWGKGWLDPARIQKRVGRDWVGLSHGVE